MGLQAPAKSRSAKLLAIKGAELATGVDALARRTLFDACRFECVLDSALALIPIDSAAFAYQLADFNTMARRAGRFLDFPFFSFCLSSFEAIPDAGALVARKTSRDNSVIGAY